MLKNLPEKLRLKQEEIKDFYEENKSILEDIVLYGSAVRGANPHDIDIILITRKLPEKEDLAYTFRKRIEEEGLEIDVKEKCLKDIFDSNFLAGGSVVLEGYSLLSEEFLIEKLNIQGYTLFKYGLENLDKNEKTQYNYAFKGRGDSEGVLKGLKGKHLSRGVVLIPIQFTADFKDFLDSWSIDYREYRVGMKKVL